MQTVLYETQHHFLLSIAPILPFLAEEVAQHRRAAITQQATSLDGEGGAAAASPTSGDGVGETGATGPAPSVFDAHWSGAQAEWHQPELARQMRLVLAAKDEVNKVLHEAQTSEAALKTPEALVLLQVWG